MANKQQTIVRLEFRRADDYPLALGPRLAVLAAVVGVVGVLVGLRVRLSVRTVSADG